MNLLSCDTTYISTPVKNINRFSEKKKPIEKPIETREQDFKNFLKKFNHDKELQLNSIKFPLESLTYLELFDSYDTLFIKKTEYFPIKIEEYYTNDEKVVVAYDFHHSNQVITTIHAETPRIHKQYIFEQLDGKWFLVKYINFSN